MPTSPNLPFGSPQFRFNWADLWAIAKPIAFSAATAAIAAALNAVGTIDTNGLAGAVAGTALVAGLHFAEKFLRRHHLTTHWAEACCYGAGDNSGRPGLSRFLYAAW